MSAFMSTFPKTGFFRRSSHKKKAEMTLGSAVLAARATRSQFAFRVAPGRGAVAGFLAGAGGFTLSKIASKSFRE